MPIIERSVIGVHQMVQEVTQQAKTQVYMVASGTKAASEISATTRRTGTAAATSKRAAAATAYVTAATHFQLLLLPCQPIKH